MSASPERFLRLDENGRHVETRPIKGTRPRGLGPMHDAALGRALAESDKDRAENVMIVDLLRNDLSRVCRPGTVRVPELFALEQHPTVHHLVSTVVGELDPAADASTCCGRRFPAARSPARPRCGPWRSSPSSSLRAAGCIAAPSAISSTTGAMDTSIVIRTYLALRGRVYFQAGGGIVADSDPELEYRETLDKARALDRRAGRPMILLLDNYDSFVYNLARYVRELGETPVVRRHDALSVDDVAAMAPSHIIISPGPCSPAEAGISTEVVRAARRQHPDPRGVSGPPVHRRRLRRGDRARGSADARQDLADPPPRRRHLPRAAQRRSAPPAITRWSSRRPRCRRTSRSPRRPRTARSWRSSTPATRCTGCSSIPNRCSPSTATAWSITSSTASRRRRGRVPAGRRRRAGARRSRAEHAGRPPPRRWISCGDHRVHPDDDGTGRRDQLRAHGRRVGRRRPSSSSPSSRPPPSATCRDTGVAVVNLTDDAMLFAQGAISSPQFPWVPADGGPRRGARGRLLLAGARGGDDR